LARRKIREQKSKTYGTQQVLKDLNHSAHIEAHMLGNAGGGRIIPRDLLLSGILTPSPIGTTENNYDPTGLRDATILRLDSSSTPLTFANQGSSANPDIASTTDATSYANSSWTPPASGLIIVYVASQGLAADPNQPTISGNSLTWTAIKTVLNSATDERLTLFGANASGSATGVTTVDFGGQTQTLCTVSFFSVTGVDLTGGVAAAFIQSVSNSGLGTEGSVSLAAAASSSNRPIAGWFMSAGIAMSPRANWTEVDELSASARAETQYRSDSFETTASVTWDGSSHTWLGIAAELKQISSASTITGLSGGTAGRVLILESISASNITLSHDSVSSTAANRFYCPNNTDFVLQPRESVMIVYDALDSRWHVIADAKPAASSTYTKAVAANSNLTTSTAQATIFSQSITVTAGNMIKVKAWGTWLNNSGSLIGLTWTLTLNTDACIPVAATQASSATNEGVYFFEGFVSVSSTSLAKMVGTIQRAAGMADAGNNTTAGSSSWHSTTNNLTGTQTLKLEIKTTIDTATQTFRVLGYEIEQVPAV
jgi:hypothetical protein